VTLQLPAVAPSCNVHAHQQIGGGHLRMDHGLSGTVPATMSMLNTESCNMWQNVSTARVCVSGRMRRHAEWEHDVLAKLADFASGYYSYYRHHLAAPHHTTHSSPCNSLHVPAGFGYTSPSAAVCGTHTNVVSSQPTARTAALPFEVQSAELCFAGQSVEWRPTVFSTSLPTAMLIIYRVAQNKPDYLLLFSKYAFQQQNT